MNEFFLYRINTFCFNGGGGVIEYLNISDKSEKKNIRDDDLF